MPAVGSILCFLLLMGCRDEPTGPGASASAAATQRAETAATTPAPERTPASPPAGEEPVITVDDTVPSATSEEDEAEEEGPEDACAPEGSDLKPMQLLRFSFASGLEGKDPKDELSVARPGQRVYAHLTMRNRSGRARCLRLVFRVGGKKRTEVTLKIGKSWSWRTWAYNTIKADDRGPLELTIEDDQGNLVLQKKLPVIPEG